MFLILKDTSIQIATVFYGYKEVGLKCMEHQRRYTKYVPDIVIHEDNVVTVSQELFLSNRNNKRQFI